MHISITPVAGSPVRIVNALNSHTCVESRLVTLMPAAYGQRTFDSDLSYLENTDHSKSVIESADIIHFHQYFDLKNNGFGINFQDRIYQKKTLLRHYHSVPWHGGWSQEKVLSEPLPKLVIAQYPERYYPDAYVVPNIIPKDDPLYLPCEEKEGPIRIFFAPSSSAYAWEDRWNTKGAPETIRLLKKIKKKYRDKVEILIVQNTPHRKCMQLRKNCHIAIDEMITGSFHLASLEALAQGKPTLGFLDDRIKYNLKNLTGSDFLPWVESKLEDAEVKIEELINDHDYRIKAGESSRRWIDTYYSDSILVGKFLEVYEKLLNNKKITSFGMRFDRNDSKKMWEICGKADEDWRLRKRKLSSPKQVLEAKVFMRKVRKKLFNYKNVEIF